MQIVIDIPEETYPEVCWRGLSLCPRDKVNLVKAIRNGTPLPKGHGRMIDADELELDTEWDDYYDGFTSYSEMQIRVAPTIIEADTEGEEK